MWIVSAKYVAPLKVELHFNDGIIKTIDVGAFIRKHPHPQYNSYLNENKFKKFKIEFGNIVWGKNWPDFVTQKCPFCNWLINNILYLCIPLFRGTQKVF